MLLKKDIFFLDSKLGDDKKIIYAPLQRKLGLVTKKFAEDFDKIPPEQLASLGLTQNYEQEVQTPKSAFSHMMILPTSDCNLRCLYCYASAGEKKDYLDFKTAKIGMDFVLQQNPRASLSFHGGGEPLMNFNTVKACTDYLRSVSKEPHTMVSICTNGVMSDKQLEWLLENIDNFCVSFDGLKEIQNMQRPTAAGGESYDAVVKTISALRDNKRIFGTRSTVTEHSVSKMEDIIENLHALGINSASIEPLYYTGRCKKSGILPPSRSAFVENYLCALERAEKYGIGLTTSSFNPEQVRRDSDGYCGACGSMIVITPQGDISTCVEMSNRADDVAGTFFCGKIENNEVKINFEKLDIFRNRTLNKMVQCRECLSKYNCAGGCVAKAYKETGDIFKQGENYCALSADLAQKTIEHLIEKGATEIKLQNNSKLCI